MLTAHPKPATTDEERLLQGNPRYTEVAPGGPRYPHARGEPPPCTHGQPSPVHLQAASLNAQIAILCALTGCPLSAVGNPSTLMRTYMQSLKRGRRGARSQGAGARFGLKASAHSPGASARGYRGPSGDLWGSSAPPVAQ